MRLRTIGLREFLRGGYQQLTEPTYVLKHAKPVGIWQPLEEGVDDVPSLPETGGREPVARVGAQGAHGP